MPNPKASTSSSEVIEAVVCQNSDIHENEMKVFEIGNEGDQVLLVKQNGKVHAIGNKCSHYGAPLVNGAVGKGRIRCPWHGACFNIATGDIEDFPGLDNIQKFECEVISGGGIKITAHKSQLKELKRNKLASMVSRDLSLRTTFVIIGGGAAGNNCAETLRTEGFQGRILVIAGEQFLPYDRCKLSKALTVDPSTLILRSQQFYKDADIEMLMHIQATKVLADEKVIHLSNNATVEYTKLFIATGARSRKIKYPGVELGNIFTLRNVDDSAKISAALKPDTDLVVIGSSFIAMEVACSSKSKVRSVTVVVRSKVPFLAQLGELLGSRIHRLFVTKGVKFELNNGVERFRGKENVSEVLLKNGNKLPADVVVLAIGSESNTDFLSGSEIVLNMDGTIPVDKFLETNVKGVYAGGDIAQAPVYASHNEMIAIGHWQLASYHGYIAAFNMIGKARPLQTVPFFWTVLFGLSFRYAGVAGKYDSLVLTGSLEELKFVAYYCLNDKVVAVATAGSDPIAAKFAEYLAANKVLSKSEVTKANVTWFEQPIN